jgi:hypothetical protein
MPTVNPQKITIVILLQMKLMTIYHFNQSQKIMEAQFNFQMKNRNDKREWENIEVYYQTHCDRTTQQYAMQGNFLKYSNQKSE